MLFIKPLVVLLFCIGAAFTRADVIKHFNQIKNDPNALYHFLKNMPKGGELHYHLAGSVYPEVMLQVAAEKGDYYIDQKTMAIKKEQDAGMHVQALMQDQMNYNQVVRAWSMKDFYPGSESGHDHFFNSFDKFMPIVVDHSPELLVDVMKRAANQNEQYLEVMILPDNANSTMLATAFPREKAETSFKTLQTQYLDNEAFQKNIQLTIDETSSLLKKAKSLLGCEQATQQNVCQLTVKFQYYVLREQPLEKVFAQALTGFAAVARSKDLIAVNLVQPEGGLISLRDYHKQMEVFDFLHQAYPNVSIALHAGELSPRDTEPADLRFHIGEALNIGHAKRIGHGVAIAYENNAEKILKKMAGEQIAVEINLTSNKEILNIEGKTHPLRYYLDHKVPVVLSTDDEGILRTDLTREYVKAVYEHGIDYPTLKQINRNALTYSFLPGKSLWNDPITAKKVDACQEMNSDLCLSFIKNNEKAKLQWQLENKLAQFEKEFK